MMPAERVRILGIPGSLRRLSYNRGLLHAARELAPEGMEIEIADLSPIPLYNADVDNEGPQPSVEALKTQIRAADGLLFATPEYNHLMPGVLKNAIDWASRPVEKNVFRGKPAAIMGASNGPTGTARAQLALRQVLAATECYVLPGYQVIIGGALDRFDANGRLTDDQARKRIRALLEALSGWVDRFGPR